MLGMTAWPRSLTVPEPEGHRFHPLKSHFVHPVERLKEDRDPPHPADMLEVKTVNETIQI